MEKIKKRTSTLDSVFPSCSKYIIALFDYGFQETQIALTRITTAKRCFTQELTS